MVLLLTCIRLSRIFSGMIKVTENAVRQLQSLLSQRSEDSQKGLRVHVSKGGCSGLHYEMTLDEQRKQRNTDRQNNARQKALSAALDAAGIVKPNLENDEQLRLREFFKVVMSSKKYTEQQARELASTTLGIAWADAE